MQYLKATVIMTSFAVVKKLEKLVLALDKSSLAVKGGNYETKASYERSLVFIHVRLELFITFFSILNSKYVGLTSVFPLLLRNLGDLVYSSMENDEETCFRTLSYFTNFHQNARLTAQN